MRAVGVALLPPPANEFSHENYYKVSSRRNMDKGTKFLIKFMPQEVVRLRERADRDFRTPAMQAAYLLEQALDNINSIPHGIEVSDSGTRMYVPALFSSRDAIFSLAASHTLCCFYLKQDITVFRSVFRYLVVSQLS